MKNLEKPLSNQYLTIIQNMIQWYDENHDPFPWRENHDPYRVWVSEIMLQQTTVKTVVPYYEMFMKRYPHINALADADIEEVLTHWQGLGYYRRARMLHKAAQAIKNDHNGVFPNTLSVLKTLPGVGDYTAKAIASIAFNDPAVPVDGNVIRVLSRVFAIKESAITLPKALASYIHDFEYTLMQHPLNSGSFAQSLMDLGREVCKPRSPLCSLCPIQRHCQAFATDQQENIPAVKVKTTTPTRYAQCVITLNRKGQFLIEKRKFKGVLHDLWQFPTTDFISSPFSPVENGMILGQVKHVFSHFKLLVDVYVCEGSSHKEDEGDGSDVWIHAHQMPDYAFSTLMQKIFTLYNKALKKAA